MKKKNKIISLFRYASIVMSLLSWYTTYQGFQNTVFARDKHAVFTAMMASLAIQTALLAGVLKYFPMIDSIKQKYQIEKQEKPEKQRIVWFKYFTEGFVISAILIFALATSITFSYGICISFGTIFYRFINNTFSIFSISSTIFTRITFKYSSLSDSISVTVVLINCSNRILALTAKSFAYILLTIEI